MSRPWALMGDALIAAVVLLLLASDVIGVKFAVMLMLAGYVISHIAHAFVALVEQIANMLARR